MNKDFQVKKIRINNQLRVLKLIINNNGITRNALAEQTKLSLMTISNVIDDLLNMKLVYEEKCEATFGRTPSNLFFNDPNGIIVGVDLTAKSTCNFIFYDLSKNVILSRNFEFNPLISYLNNINLLCESVLGLAIKNKLKILGIGISVPGAYDSTTDTVKTSLISAHCEINLCKIFSDFFQIKAICIDHDVNLASLAEMHSLDKDKSIFYLYIGDGVGGSYVDGQNVLMGKDLLAGEVGQTLVGIPTYPDTLENVVSIRSILSHMKESNLNFSMDELILRYNSGDTRIVPHIDYVLRVLDVAIYNLIWLFNPNYVVIKSSCKEYQNEIVKHAIEFYKQKKSSEYSSTLKHIHSEITDSFIEENSSITGLYYRVLDIIVNDLISTID